jgi:hypothetical protein
MSVEKTPRDKGYEGHGEDSKFPNLVSKGTAQMVGTASPLAENATSVNSKTPTMEHGAGERI